MMKLQNSGIANYVHTGGFNRLAGRPSTPGSWRPERYARWWKLSITVIGAAFLSVGTFFVLF